MSDHFSLVRESLEALGPVLSQIDSSVRHLHRDYPEVLPSGMAGWMEWRREKLARLGGADGAYRDSLAHLLAVTLEALSGFEAGEPDAEFVAAACTDLHTWICGQVVAAEREQLVAHAALAASVTDHIALYRAGERLHGWPPDRAALERTVQLARAQGREAGLSWESAFSPRRCGERWVHEEASL